jgi:hypothetical protein
MLLLENWSIRACVRRVKGRVDVSDWPEHFTNDPATSHQHSSGHINATFTGTITNHNQKTTAGVANSSDSNTTGSFDDMASC